MGATFKKDEKRKQQKLRNVEFWQNFEEWICYWRLNPQRFCTEYFGLNLYLFQKIIIYIMNFETVRNFIFWASRGTSKSWLTMVFCLEYGTLFPGNTIIVAAPSIKQANLLLAKAYDLRDHYPNIAREIIEITNNKDVAKIKLKSGTIIQTVVSSENSRGVRCNVLVLDEFRLMDKGIVDKVLVPFLTNKRTPPYTKIPKYRKFVEENKKIYLSSIGSKEEWSYKEFSSYIDRISNGDETYFTVSLPYQFGVQAGVIDPVLIKEQAESNRENMEVFRMEMEVIPYGESESQMFKYDTLMKARKLTVPLSPMTDLEFFQSNGEKKSYPRYQKKMDDEIRIVCMDIAVASGRRNDNSCIMVFRLFPHGTYYEKELSYIETMNGVNLDPQMVRLKQIFYDLECDYAVIDANGALGINACDVLGAVTPDPSRGIHYPGWRTCDQQDKFDMRVSDRNAEPVLFAIQYGGSGASAFQYNMLVTAQLEFSRQRIFLLVEEDNAIDVLNSKYKYMKLQTQNNPNENEIAHSLIQSFANTKKLLHECVNTQVARLPSGRYVFNEGSDRKDRVMCMLYGLYFINLLEKDLAEDKATFDIQQYAGGYKQPKNKNMTNPFNGRMQRLSGFGAKR